MPPMRAESGLLWDGVGFTPAASHTNRSTSLMKMFVSAETASGRNPRNHRRRFGTEFTHCRMGTGGMT